MPGWGFKVSQQVGQAGGTGVRDSAPWPGTPDSRITEKKLTGMKNRKYFFTINFPHLTVNTKYIDIYSIVVKFNFSLPIPPQSLRQGF